MTGGGVPDMKHRKPQVADKMLSREAEIVFD